MIRTILKSDQKKVTLDLPDDLVGKMIEIIAFSVDDAEKGGDPLPKESRIKDLEAKLKSYAFNSGGYRFDRTDSNDYE